MCCTTVNVILYATIGRNCQSHGLVSPLEVYFKVDNMHKKKIKKFLYRIHQVPAPDVAELPSYRVEPSNAVAPPVGIWGSWKQLYASHHRYQRIKTPKTTYQTSQVYSLSSHLCPILLWL